MTRKLLSLFKVITLYMIVGCASAEPDTPELTLGITPQHLTMELAKMWGPICQYLSSHTGYHVQFKTSKDLQTFWIQTDEGAFDLIYITPPRYVSAHAAAAYVAFAQEGNSPLVGIIVVREKDGPTRIEELQGEKLAVPNLVAFGAAQVPKAYLLGKGVSVTLVPVNNHESVFRTVEKGLYPAGASNLRIFGMLDPVVQAQFRILWKSEPLPPFAFAAHPRVPHKMVERIRKALVEMDRDVEGRALLLPLNIKGIVSAQDSDYDGMRKMKLKLE
jgi:phosphonate transport system substrate-binding protein